MSRKTVTGRDPTTGRPIRVIIDNGRIAELLPGDDTETMWLSAGLIDLQVNGYAGHDVNADTLSADTVIALASALRHVGVTTVVPTIISASEGSIIGKLRAVAEARTADRPTANAIPYVHVEGPHVSPEDGPRGAHPLSAIRPPDIAEFDRWQRACAGLVGMVTLSPHFDGALEYIRALRHRNVHVAIGHTHATPQQISDATNAGATLSTHLGNGVAATLPRHPNLIWTQLADDRLVATLIADGHHLCADTLRAMVRAKGLDRCILISDVTALGGMLPGTYTQNIGGRVELTCDGRLHIPGTPFLAGAARTLADDIVTAIEMTDLTLGAALGLATRNPGRFIGGRGTLEVGAVADLIRFSWSMGDAALKIDAIFTDGVECQ